MESIISSEPAANGASTEESKQHVLDDSRRSPTSTPSAKSRRRALPGLMSSAAAGAAVARMTPVDRRAAERAAASLLAHMFVSVLPCVNSVCSAVTLATSIDMSSPSKDLAAATAAAASSDATASSASSSSESTTGLEQPLGQMQLAGEAQEQEQGGAQDAAVQGEGEMEEEDPDPPVDIEIDLNPRENNAESRQRLCAFLSQFGQQAPVSNDAEPLRLHFPSGSSWDTARQQLETGPAGADVWRAPHDLVTMIGVPPPVFPPGVGLSVLRFTGSSARILLAAGMNKRQRPAAPMRARCLTPTTFFSILLSISFIRQCIFLLPPRASQKPSSHASISLAVAVNVSLFPSNSVRQMSPLSRMIRTLKC